MFSAECYATVQSLQLSKADLPPAYNDALQDFNLAQQKVETTKKMKENTVIEMKTNMQNAMVAAPIVVNQAKAAINALMANNEAAVDAYVSVTESEADSYKAMMDKLEYNKGDDPDKDILSYVMVKTIGNYNEKNTIIKMEDL